MSASADDATTLEQDAAFDQPLRRVAYEAGMLLGLEATRDEQDYHRRRLNRHQYWLHGAGTVAGMLVKLDPAQSADPDQDMGVRVLVGPGLGVDGLGREILVHEPYCLNLRDWLAAQSETRLREGYEEADQRLWLRVSVRYQDCPVAAQPVLARKLNLGTDPVQPSRTADGLRIQLDLGLPPQGADEAFQPWSLHPALADELPVLSADEQAQIDAASGAAKDQLELQARLLHALDQGGVSAQAMAEELEVRARLLLARISIQRVDDLDDILLSPARIRVNNLVRPFLVSAGQLAYLARQQP